MRPVKWKPYKDHNFALRINPLEVEEDDLHLLKMHHLPRLRFGEDSHVAPPYTKMGEAPQRQIFTWPLSSNGWQAPSIWHLLVDHLKLAPHHLTPSFMSYTRSSFWCKLMTRHLTQHRDTKHIDHGLVHKAILTSAHHTMRSHDPSWYKTSLVCWSTCTKPWST